MLSCHINQGLGNLLVIDMASNIISCILLCGKFARPLASCSIMLNAEDVAFIFEIYGDFCWQNKVSLCLYMTLSEMRIQNQRLYQYN